MFYITLVSILTLILFILYKRFTLSKLREKNHHFSVAFLHPYCNAGGGGEKKIIEIRKTLSNHNQVYLLIVVYSAEDVNDEDIIEKANTRFNSNLVNNIKFIRVLKRYLLQPQKRFTMLFQIIGQMIYAYYCINAFQPNILIDTTGLPFSYLIFKVFMPKVRVIPYVHYPFISYDMINQVREKRQRFNNQQQIAQSNILTNFKLIYYVLILLFYKTCGLFVDYAYANSTWTYNHMKLIWNKTLLIKLYPPCTVDALLKRKQFTNKFIIVSFAQFRPEKQHKLQIEIMECLRDRLPKEISQQLELQMIGSVRNEDDEQLFQQLFQEIEQKDLQNHIKMYKNPPFQQVVQILSSGMIGLHTMEYEHFGITLVEMLAAGLIVIAHNSAGPKYDILKDNIGFLCQDKEDYILNIVKIMQLNDDERLQYQINGRKQAVRFSDESFIEAFQIV